MASNNIKRSLRPVDAAYVELDAKRGTGAFQWNRGGWFGSQLGATLWLLIVGAMTVAHDRALGALLLFLGALPNALGVLLWSRRSVLSPYPALQALLVLCGLSALAAICSVRAFGLSPSSLGLPSAWLLMLFPGLMLLFHVRERGARNAAGQQAASERTIR